VSVFVDTSALFAFLDSADANHVVIRDTLDELGSTPLVSHSYVVTESVALVERRLGRAAVRDLLGELVSQLLVIFVDRSTHDAAVNAYLGSAGRSPSLVDFTSFEVMRQFGIRRALAVDRDFADAGFDVIPG
jgi:predicted nucleic acid-binding protein